MDPQVLDDPKDYSDTVIFDVQTFAMLTFFRSDGEKAHHEIFDRNLLQEVEFEF